MIVVVALGGLSACARAAPDPPFDPRRPLTDYARARVGNYHSTKDLKLEWRSDDGTVVRRMRIPAEYVMYADYGRVRESRERGVATPAPRRGFDNDVRRVTLGIWLTGDSARPVISLKRALAERTPGDEKDPPNGTRLIVRLEGRYVPGRTPAWGSASPTRGVIALALNDGGVRALEPIANLERYRAQTCGPHIEQQLADMPRQQGERARNDCRDLDGPMENLLSPATVVDGVSLMCDVFHPTNWHRCHSEASQHEGWGYSFTFAKAWLERWREVKTVAEQLQLRFVINDQSQAEQR